MKKILYLHGLDSYPKPDKVNIFKTKGEVVAPKLNYYAFQNDITLFNELANSIKLEKITHIVGSSFGGYMGFYLSEYCKIPAILFNPAIAHTSIEVPVINDFNNSSKNLILGIHDDVVNPANTIKFINENHYSNSRIVKENFGHQVPLNIFSLALNYI
ncbi:YqiA/YcfP family alpha/beta fold hydrolase [Bacteroidota bacterium]